MGIVFPTFQPQNPAINGYSLGWASCTAYSGAMAAAFERQVKVVMSGESLRRRTGDTSGGTNLAQIDNALVSGWSINLAVYYRLPWSTFQKFINSGMGGILQGWYAPIADSRFDAGNGFRGNHAIFVPPNWGVMDPLADGRRSGVYKYRGEPYPPSLLKNFAGKLNLSTSGYRPLGDGLVYCAMTRDKTHTYGVAFTGGGAFWVYRVGPDGRISGRYSKRFTKSTSASCTVAAWYQWPGHVGRSLVRMTTGGLAGEYVAVPQDNARLVVIP